MSKRNRIVNKTRRANNEGSIFQRANGIWAGMATVGYGEDGKIIRKSVYGRTRMEVGNKLTELTNRIINNNFDYVSHNNFGEMMNEWMLVFKKTQVSPRTFEHNYRNFKLHILTKIGKMKIDEINTLIIQKLLNEMLDRNYSLASVRKIKFLLNQFFEYAIENKLTNENPATKTRVKSSERKIYDGENTYKAIPLEIRDKFIKCLDENDFLKPFCFTMLFCGLRTGEALALRWDNVDFENKVLQIQYGVTIVPKFDEKGNITERTTVIGDTKTACSVREVPMPDILINALKNYKERQWIISEEKHIDLLAPNMLVFANKDGSVRTYSGTKKIFENFLKKYNLNIYGIHFHGLRHTYSNMLFEANENPKIIQALLGHKSVKTTITTYNSVDKSYFKKTTDIFNVRYPVLNKKEDLKEKSKIEDLSSDQIDNLLEELLRRKQERKREQDEEM